MVDNLILNHIVYKPVTIVYNSFNFLLSVKKYKTDLPSVTKIDYLNIKVYLYFNIQIKVITWDD